MRKVIPLRSLLFVLFILVLVVESSAQAQNSGAATQSPAPVTPEVLTRLERAQTTPKDWPNLSRYHDANSKLAPPSKGEDRVVFIGDSITDSWKLIEYFPGKPYVNRGISGQTTPQMLIRFRPGVIAHKPRAVIILAGTNEIAGSA